MPKPWSHYAVKVVVRVAYTFAAVLLFMAAALQWNDPDPWHWIGIYGLAGVFCAVGAAGRRAPPSALGLFIALTLGYAIYLGAVYFGGYAATPMHAATLPADAAWYKIEEAREMVGLLVVTAILLTMLPWHAVNRAHCEDGDANA